MVLDQSGYIIDDNNFKTTDKNILLSMILLGQIDIYNIKTGNEFFVNNNFNNKKDFIKLYINSNCYFLHNLNVASIGWNENQKRIYKY